MELKRDHSCQKHFFSYFLTASKAENNFQYKFWKAIAGRQLSLQNICYVLPG